MKVKSIFKSIKRGLYEKIHNQPLDTEDTVLTASIIVPWAFRTKESRPSNVKMIARRKYFAKYGRMDEAIEVEVKERGNGLPPKLILRNGYTRYLVAKEFGELFVKIKYIKSK